MKNTTIFKRLLGYLKAYRLRLFFVLLSAVISTAFMVLAPFLVGKVTTTLFASIADKVFYWETIIWLLAALVALYFREQYPAGTRICLNSMDGEAGMPQGLEGTVQYVDDAGQLGVKWDNGRSLSLIPGVDSFHKKEGQGHPEEKPRKKRESDLQR